MTPLARILAAPSVACRPCPRHELSPDEWRSLAATLPSQPELAFVALWADGAQVHALFWSGGPVLASTTVEAGLYAALSPARPGAALFERAVADLWGHQAADATDVRAWLDHGTWPLLRPLSDRPVPNTGAPDVPELHDWSGDTIGLGPLPPTLAGPAHWRVTLEGDGVAALEARLGYGHRGILGLMRGKSPPGAARLAARIDGAATVAHSTAFARAVELAFATPAPPRAAALRTVLLAVERVTVTLHDAHAVLGVPALQKARADLLAACDAAFGHRLLMDVVRPGGLAAEPAGLDALAAALLAVSWPDLAWPPGGVLPVADALAFAPAGAVGRASGRLDPAIPVAPVDAEGGVAARMRLRFAAIDRDLEHARAILAALPAGPVQAPLPHDSAEGLGRADGPQGPVWHWVRFAGGLVSASFAADPGWLHLPCFEAAARGSRLDALPGIAASFGLHHGGMEL